MTEATDRWWLPDFRILGGDSVVTLEARPGGALLESRPDGQSLLWFTVQMVVPGQALHLVGHTAPAWGGPTLSMLGLTLEERGQGCVLKVSDGLIGRVDEAQVKCLSEGWQQLFGEGLKAAAEG